VLVLSFLAMTAFLVRRNPRFPFLLFLFVAVVAAVAGANNVWHFYNGLPPLDRTQLRFEGVPGLTMYYNSNWIAQLYGIVCVGAVAAATRPGTRPVALVMLGLSALMLFGCVGLTQTRSVLIGVLAGLAVVIVLLPGQTTARRCVQIAVIAAAIFASIPFIDVLIARGDPYRIAFWKAFLVHVEANPWTGSGLPAQLLVKAPDGAETTHPHNIFYHALLRGGAFAALALAAFMAAACVQSLRAWRMTGSALYPALIVTAFLPLQLEFTVLVGTAPGWDWLVLWMPIGLSVGAVLPGATRTGAVPATAA
jgi:hypothetical protein